MFDPARLPPRFDVLRTLPRERACELPRVDADRLVLPRAAERLVPPRADAELVLPVRAVFRLAEEREPAVFLPVVAPARLRDVRAVPEARERAVDRLREDAAVRERDPAPPRVEADRVVLRAPVLRARDDVVPVRLVLFF